MKSVSIVFPKIRAEWNAPAGGWYQPGPTGTEPASNAYQDDVPSRPSRLLYWTETIDMSAFVVQDQTFFPLDIRISDPGIPLCGPLQADWNDAASLQILDLISNVPIGREQIIEFQTGIMPGMPQSKTDMQFILYGRYHAYSNNTSSSFPGLMNMVKSSTFGAGLPTASDKLYCIRIVKPLFGIGFPAPSPQATMNIPATSYEIVGEATVEEELERIYRLRQSYEQKQG